MTPMPPAAPVRWDALVLGGGDPGDPFAQAHGVAVKPLIEVGGAPMALSVLRALRGSGRIGAIAYVGPQPAGTQPPGAPPLVDLGVTDHGTLLSNLEVGVEALSALTARRAGSASTPRILVVTADIPMLTAGMVGDLLDAASAGDLAGAGLVYPVVRRSDCEAAYPGVRRTYARLKGDAFTGGNLFMLDPALVGRFLPRLREVLAARKQPVRLARLIGWSVLARLLSGRLGIPDLEAKVSAILGVKARALITPHAAVGTDVDQEADLQLAERVLAARRASETGTGAAATEQPLGGALT